MRSSHARDSRRPPCSPPVLLTDTWSSRPALDALHVVLALRQCVCGKSANAVRSASVNSRRNAAPAGGLTKATPSPPGRLSPVSPLRPAQPSCVGRHACGHSAARTPRTCLSGPLGAAHQDLLGLSGRRATSVGGNGAGQVHLVPRIRPPQGVGPPAGLLARRHRLVFYGAATIRHGLSTAREEQSGRQRRSASFG